MSTSRKNTNIIVCPCIAIPNPGEREEIVEKEIINTIVSKGNIHWGDVIGLDKEKRALREMLIHPFRASTSQLYPEGSTEKGILLFGLSGSGKTLLINWIIPMLENMTVFNVSVGNIVSRYRAESANLVRQLFAEARRRRPSLICFDNADGLFWEITDGSSECRSEMLSAFLEETDEEADNRNIFLLCSTDMPWVMDKDVKSRFSKHIYVARPNHQMRISLFESLLTSVNGLGPKDYATLAGWTKGFTCDDIRKICDKAKALPTCELDSADHFKQIGESAQGRPVFVPCTKKAIGAAPMRLADVQNVGELGPIRQVKKEDVFKCALGIKPFVDESGVEKMESYAKQHDLSFHGHWEGCRISEEGGSSPKTNRSCAIL